MLGSNRWGESAEKTSLSCVLPNTELLTPRHAARRAAEKGRETRESRGSNASNSGTNHRTALQSRERIHGAPKAHLMHGLIITFAWILFLTNELLLVLSSNFPTP